MDRSEGNGLNVHQFQGFEDVGESNHHHHHRHHLQLEEDVNEVEHTFGDTGGCLTGLNSNQLLNVLGLTGGGSSGGYITSNANGNSTAGQLLHMSADLISPALKFGDYYSGQQRNNTTSEQPLSNVNSNNGGSTSYLNPFNEYQHLLTKQQSNNPPSEGLAKSNGYIYPSNQFKQQTMFSEGQSGIGKPAAFALDQGNSQQQQTSQTEQQKQMKLMNALKSNPQDLELILEEQEQQSNQLQKKLKIEADGKQANNINHPLGISLMHLSNYSPPPRDLKRVESNTSLNGGGNQQSVHHEKIHSKNPSSIKGNVKNAYIKKISSLLNLQSQAAATAIPQEQQQQNAHQHQMRQHQDIRRQDNSDDSDDSRSKSFDNLKQEDGKKVMKNRESARNSRQRKKIYIELLEKKISQLSVSIEDQCVNIEKSQKEICKILDNHNHIKAFVQTRHEYIQKIGEMASSDKPNNEQLGYVLDSLRLRIGAQGSSRQKAMSLYFRTIMKQYMQSTFPYMIYGYKQKISEDMEFNRCVDIFKQICKITDEQQVFKFLPYLKQLHEMRICFKDSFLRMKKIRKQTFRREESIEKLLDGLSLLHPQQMGKFLKGLDKFRKYKEIRLQRRPTSGDNNPQQFEVDQSIFQQHQQVIQQQQHSQFSNPQQISHSNNKIRSFAVANQYAPQQLGVPSSSGLLQSTQMQQTHPHQHHSNIQTATATAAVNGFVPLHYPAMMPAQQFSMEGLEDTLEILQKPSVPSYYYPNQLQIAATTQNNQQQRYQQAPDAAISSAQQQQVTQQQQFQGMKQPTTVNDRETFFHPQQLRKQFFGDAHQTY